jgi:hypothetical protein
MAEGWFNEHSTLHDQPPPQVTTNGLLFTAIYHLLIYMNYGSVDRIAIIKCLDAHIAEDGWFRNKPGTDNPHMSADNWLGVQILSKLGNLNYHKMFFIKDFWGRPQPWDIIWNAYFAGGIYRVFAYPFLWICTITMSITMMKTMHKNGHPDSSGKQLAFGQMYTSNMKITQWICKKLLYRNKLFGSWYSVVTEYYKNPDHPTRALMKLWEDK